MKRIAIVLALVVARLTWAGTAAPEIEQRLGAVVPPTLQFTDAAGQPMSWQRIASAGRPIVLLPAYYRCDTLCGTVAHGALEALADTGLGIDAWQLVLFSIDPHETAADAAPLQAVYAKFARWSRPQVFAEHPPDITLLTGDAANVGALAQAIGFRWAAMPARDGQAQYVHATGLVVLTPGGVVSRYLFGVRFDPPALRSALVEASGGKIGTLTDRLLLACAHFDPLPGSHDGLVLGGLRGLALATIAGLAGWIWRHRRTPAR